MSLDGRFALAVGLLLLLAPRFACSDGERAAYDPDAPPPDPDGRAEAGRVDWDAWRWRHRPLVVLSPAADDPRLAAMRRRLAGARDGLADRNLVVVVAAGRETTVDARSASARAAADLRERFDVPADAFAVLLVGKDGTVKLRETKPVAVDRLFALVDAMPMRRREMRRSGR